jgi:hypothetical protein
VNPDPESVLNRFRLSAPAAALRDRVLARARRERRERRLFRRTWALAAAVLAICASINSALEFPPPPETPPPQVQSARLLAEAVEGTGVEARFRVAMAPARR